VSIWVTKHLFNSLMLTPEQIYRRALNRYPDFLRLLCTGKSSFPLAVFGAGLAKVNNFVADRAGIELLRKQSKEQLGFGYEIIWEERKFRRLGTQKIPSAVTFPTQEDYVGFLNKQTELRQFQSDYSLIQKQCPELCVWAQTKPLKAVAHAGVWQGLLDVCLYLRNNPRPNCYLRELPVVVDTKFIENHKGILSELLPIAVPQTVCLDNSSFETRFGFRLKQPLVRMRFLDTQLAARLGFSVADLATPLDEFRNLPFGDNTVLIVENEMTFLVLPSLPGTIAIYGAGDAAALLASVVWLHSCRVFYWGDLDSHGFEILSNLRKEFTDVTSVLMDEDTFTSHSSFAIAANATRTKSKLNLVLWEQCLYERLVEKRILVEQERIPDIFSKARLIRAIMS
jgi:hypothetical protein